MHNNKQLKQTRNRTNYELTMITLKGETFAGFKIQRQSAFYFVIDVARCYALFNVHWFAETV